MEPDMASIYRQQCGSNSPPFGEQDIKCARRCACTHCVGPNTPCGQPIAYAGGEWNQITPCTDQNKFQPGFFYNPLKSVRSEVSRRGC
jgi:hypothetical protein